MRIGIDARFLTHPQPGGFKTYTTNLIQALGTIDRTNEYTLYVDRPYDPQDLPSYPNFHYKIVDGSVQGIGVPLREQFGLRRQLLQDRLDLVHFLCNTATVSVAQKYIVTLHDTIQLHTASRFRPFQSLSQQKQWAMNAYSKWAIQRSVQRAHRVITVSAYEQGVIAQELGLPSDRIAVTHLAANSIYAKADAELCRTWKGEISERYQVKGDVILGVGYEPRKKIDLLIRAFALVAAGDENAHLILVCAEQHQREVFRKLVEQMSLERRVTLLGAQAPHQLNILYNIADLFVFPSERESFGLPPLEAIACGVPTIAMNMTSLPEIMQDGALFIDGQEPQIWANAIHALLSDSVARDELAKRGLRRAAQLNWLTCARETLEVYHSAVHGIA